MLSEFIQLNAFKSHPNLPRAVAIKTDNAKFSLQFPKNTPFKQPQDSQQLIPKKFGNTPWKETIEQANHKDTLISSKFSNASIKPIYGYFGSRESSINERQGRNYPRNLQNTNNKTPLILSPKKEHSLNKYGGPSIKKTPLIISSSNKFFRLNSQERQCSQRVSSMESSGFRYSLQKRMPLIKSMQQQIQGRNLYGQIKDKHRESKKILLKSTSQQNLSPLKQKLYKITNRTNQQNLKNHDKATSKRNIHRSDSFKRIIEQSRQKKNIPNNQKQNRATDLNVQYFIGANVKRSQPVKKQSRKMLTNTDKLIKSPYKKPHCLMKAQRSPQIQKFEIHRKKVDSFVEQHVLNSNMFSLNQENSSILNMDPY